MLLKKQVKDTTIKALYDSSNVLASTYDTAAKTLVLIFKHGGQYKYSDVSINDYTRLELAESQGEVFNKYIKKYTTEKLDKIDVSQILNEAEKLAKAEQDALYAGKRQKIVNYLHNAAWVADINLPREVFDENLKELGEEIKKYFDSI